MQSPRKATPKNIITIRCTTAGDGDQEAEDIIDLGAPKRLKSAPPENLPKSQSKSLRIKSSYTPNPRLYPGPKPKAAPKSKPKRIPRQNRSEGGRGRRRKRRFTRPVPNARLYRPAPPRPPPPPAVPNAFWPPPSPPRPLDTASKVALRLSEQRRASRAGVQRPAAPARNRSPYRRHSLPRRSSPPRHQSPHRRRSPPRNQSPPHRRSSPRRLSPPRHTSPARAKSPPPLPLQSKHLVVTLPTTTQNVLKEEASYSEEQLERYRPKSAHFRLRSLDTDSGSSTPVGGRFYVAPPEAPKVQAMDASNRQSASPEDCSDANETTSAPSEFLAEFLSAIMRRQYAEALKYCRLILQYEPHNKTARGFYPLLRQKLETQKKSTAERGSSSEESHNDASAGKRDRRRLSEKRVVLSTAQPCDEAMNQEADDSPSEECVAQSRSRTHSEGSCASQSSLELDSSDAVAQSSPSLSFSRRTGQTDSASVSGAWCASAGSASGSRSDPDDNGNQISTFTYQAGDVENDNAAAGGEPLSGTHLKNETSSLQRLRAQFTCSIK